MPFCNNCGQQYQEGMPQCPNCGAPLMQQTPQPNQVVQPVNFQQQPKKKKHGCLIAIGIFVLLGIIGSIFGGARNKTTPETEQTSSVATDAPEKETKPKAQTTAKTKAKTEEAKTTETETQPVESEPEETTAPELSASDIQQMIKDGDYSLVTPEFKSLMDSYEGFIDEYVDFMKKYNSGEGDMMAMLNDYMDMATKLTEWSNKIDAINEADLSVADDAYYLLVTVRCSQKLLSAV